MGTSRSAAELASKLGKLSAEYKTVPYEVVSGASLLVKKNVLARAPARLSGVGKRGARLSAGYNIDRFDGVAKSIVFARGPWQLIERNTRAGVRQARGGRGRQKKFVVPGYGYNNAKGWGPGGVRLAINHPGTKGKHPWEKGVQASVPFISKLLSKEAVEALRRVV